LPQVGIAGTRQPSHHDLRAGRKTANLVTHQMAQLPNHPVSFHGIADNFAHNKTRSGR
jgi:hypothetical protein